MLTADVVVFDWRHPKAPLGNFQSGTRGVIVLLSRQPLLGPAVGVRHVVGHAVTAPANLFCSLACACYFGSCQPV